MFVLVTIFFCWDLDKYCWWGGSFSRKRKNSGQEAPGVGKVTLVFAQLLFDSSETHTHRKTHI